MEAGSRAAPVAIEPWRRGVQVASPRDRTIIVVHQIGSVADGGVRSISELIANSPGLPKLIVTNRETRMNAEWSRHAEVEVWDIAEREFGGQGGAGRLRQVARRILNNFRMYRTVRARGVGVVHCNDRRSFWNMALGARAAGAKVVLNVRDTLRPGSRSGWLWRASLRLCDRFLVLSQEMERAWIAALRPDSEEPRQAAKFAYLYSIVDLTKHHPPADAAERAALRAELGLAEDEFAIAYVARVDAKKRQLDLIREAAPRLAARLPGAKVHFVGDHHPENDPYAAACSAAVAELDLARTVKFEGHSLRPADWYRAADVVLLASEREGLPRAIIEGAANGTPVVAFDVCSVREILEGHDCGRAVASGDYPGLVDSLVELHDDPALRTRLGANGADAARRLFRGESVGARYEDMIRRLAG